MIQHVSLSEYAQIMRGEKLLPHQPGGCADCAVLFNRMKHTLLAKGIIPTEVGVSDQQLFVEYAVRVKTLMIDPSSTLNNNELSEINRTILARESRIRLELFRLAHNQDPEWFRSTSDGTLGEIYRNLIAEEAQVNQ